MKLFIYLILLIFISSCSSGDMMKEEYGSLVDSTYYQDSSPILSESTVEYPLEKEIKRGSIRKEFKKENLIEKQSKYIGDITHLINDTMEYGKPYPVDLVISYKTPIDIISNEVQSFRKNLNNLSTQKIIITPIMKAKLVDPTKNSFKIIPITDSIQQVDMEDETYTMWQWKVVPIKGGNNELVLNVDMIVGDNKKSLKIYNDIIFVKVKTIDKLSGWIEKNWKYITYIISTIGIIIAWLYKEQIIILFKRNKNN